MPPWNVFIRAPDTPGTPFSSLDYTVATSGTYYLGVSTFTNRAYNPNGTLITTFAPVFDGPVRALAVTNDTIYAGGMFTSVNGVPRSRLAAVDAAGGLVGNWDPVANDQVTAMAVAPDGGRVVVGGRFTTIDGSGAYGLGAVSTSTGTLVPFAANTVVRDGGANGCNRRQRVRGRRLDEQRDRGLRE